MAWEMQIKILGEGGTESEWASVKPSGSHDPYRFKTKDTAEGMLDLCYPCILPGLKRVIEVEKEVNCHL
jgi:hypothetical protein